MLLCFQRVRGQKRFFPARKVTQTLPKCLLTTLIKIAHLSDALKVACCKYARKFY